MIEVLKYCKVREVKSPVRAHAEDAGIDFYIPENIDVDTFTSKCDMVKDYVSYNLTDDYYIKDIILTPGQSILIPSGIHVKIPHGYALIFMNKSGVATKKHLHVGACVVDETYQGECHLNVTNVGKDTVTISAGEKLVQGLIIPISFCQTEEILSLDELYKGFETTRGSGGFGSTGQT